MSQSVEVKAIFSLLSLILICFLLFGLSQAENEGDEVNLDAGNEVQELECRISKKGDICFNRDLIIKEQNARVTAVTGNFDDVDIQKVENIIIRDATVNYVPDLSVIIKKLPNFKNLGILNSQLKQVDRHQLAKLPQLESLSFHENVIESLAEDVFDDLVNLKNIWIGMNKIKVLPPKLLHNLPNLIIFTAWDNQIEIIPGGFFENNKQLEEVHLYDNKIEKIEVNFLELPKLKVLSLTNNTCVDDCVNCDWLKNTSTINDIQVIVAEKC